MALPITGRIFLGGMTFPCPTGMLWNIGLDSTHFVMAKGDAGGDKLQIHHCETLNDQSNNITQTRFRDDIFDELGLVDGGSGTQVIGLDIGYQVPDTPYILALADRESTVVAGYEVIGIIYALASSGVTNVAGHYHYRITEEDLDGGGYGGALGCEVIDGFFYAVDGFGSSGPGFRVKLLKLPLESEIDLTVGSWDKRSYRLPDGEMTSTTWWASTSRDPKNFATVFKHADGIGVLAYKTVFEGEPASTLWLTVVDTTLPPPVYPLVTHNGQNDISALFNLPFPDEGFDGAGNPSIFGDDWYTNPAINVLSGNRLEWVWSRGVSDQDGTIKIRRFITTSDLSSIITEFPLVTFAMSDEAGATCEAVHSRRQGGFLQFMIRENDALTFNALEVDTDECPSSGFDLQYPPCVTAWTQCVKIQRRDGVSFRFTSLDQDIEFRGETYVTCGGLDPSATQVTAQLGEVGSSELAGLIVATGVKETELYGGLFDDAFVEIWLVPFEGESASTNDIARRLAAGWAGKVSHSTRGYKMEVLGPGARLDQRPIVQVYSPQCRWVFGDSRCGVDIDSLAVNGSVTSGINRGNFLATLGPEASSGTGAAASSGELAAQFSNGRVRWLTGVNAGQVTEVKSVDFDTGQIILWALTCFVPEVGDTFDLLPGCAQDFATCKDLYDNALNFGGFPYVPGRDAISQTPNAKL